MAINLASKYSDKVDERFAQQSQASLVTNDSYDFIGVDTVNVYAIDTVPLSDYSRTGANRYGNPSELGNTVQSMHITQDKSWTFTIDKGNFKQSEMVMNAGRACARQVAQVVIPAYDKYVFTALAKGAYAITEGNTHPHANTTAATKSNAYELFLKAQEVLGDAQVPDAGRVALCSYKFANLLKQDPAFMRYGDVSQEMIRKGIIGEIDGVKVVRIPASRLPSGCNFIVAHPMACVAPRQLWEYKIHTDAPGISGWLCEGRILYDAFVLENKRHAIYYSGATTDLT